MKYVAATFSYLKKHFWLPLAVMIVPSVIACFLYSPYWEVSFVSAYDYYPYVPIKQSFRIIFGDPWLYLWPVIVIGIFQVVGAALITSAIGTHLRTGKLSLKHPFRMVNTAIFPTALCVAIMCAVSILWRFILFGLTTLVCVIGNAAGLPAGATLAVIAVIACVMFFFHVLIITPMLYWSPIMAFYGYGFRDAAAASFKLISGKKVFGGLFFPMLLCAAIQLLIGFLNVHVWITWVMDAVIFLVTNAYVPVYVVISFYKISGLDRRDVLPYELSLPSPVRQTATTAAKASGATEPKADESESETPKNKTDNKNKADKHSDKKTAEKGARAKNDGKKQSNKTEKSGKTSVKPRETKRVEPKPSKQEAKSSATGGEDVV